MRGRSKISLCLAWLRFVPLLLLWACLPAKEILDSPLSGQGAEAARADPGYMSYLERRSMLNHASRLSQIVSGSNMNWRHPANEPMPEHILAQGDVWLHIHPQNVRSSLENTPLRQLDNPLFWAMLRKTGIGGLYVAPTGASGSLRDTQEHLDFVGSGDIIQYTFAGNVGTEDDYAQMLRHASEQKILLGGDILPLASGIGPDFFLSAHNVRDYPGLYCMLEAPRALWPHLPPSPPAGDDWRVLPLNEEQTAALAEAGFIPKKMRQESLPYVPKSGWAATGEVKGADGTTRRWVYRYVYNYRRPLLNLYDPSHLADKLLSGSLIYQVGILGNALAGFQTAPLIGLEAEGTEQRGIDNPANYMASLGLAGELARQSRAYGGWTWLRDELPLPLMRAALRSGPDLAKDGVFSPALEHALLSGRKELLEFMLDEALRHEVDFRRLVHISSGPYGVDYSLPHLRYLAGMAEDSAAGGLKQRAAELLELTLEQAGRRALAAAGGEESLSAFEGNVLYSTPLGLAGTALGPRPPDALAGAFETEARRGHMLLQFFKAMLPGIFMLGGQDLAGTMPLRPQILLQPDGNWNRRLSTAGSYPLTLRAETSGFSGQGIPAARNIYGPLDAQSHDPNSALNELAGIIRLRRELHMDKATLAGRLRTRGEGMLALFTRLPEDSPLSPPGRQAGIILLGNFSRLKSEEKIDLAGLPELAALNGRYRLFALYGNMGGIYQQQNQLILNAPPWSGAVLLLEKL